MAEDLREIAAPPRTEDAADWWRLADPAHRNQCYTRQNNVEHLPNSV